MIKRGLREEEIELCFKQNPDLLGKSMKQIAMFFMIQGELSASHTREAMTRKANFYRHKLGLLDDAIMKEADQKWKEEMDLG